MDKCVECCSLANATLIQITNNLLQQLTLHNILAVPDTCLNPSLLEFFSFFKSYCFYFKDTCKELPNIIRDTYQGQGSFQQKCSIGGAVYGQNTSWHC